MASVVCWNNLPSVVLLEIFKMISHEERINASTTCREWRKALFFPNFWRDLTIKVYSKNDRYAVERCQFFAKSFLLSLRNVRIIFSYKKSYLMQVTEVLCKLSENRQVKKLFLFGFGKSSTTDPNLSCCAENLINFLENVKSLNSLHISHCWLLLVNNNGLGEALEKHRDSLVNLGIGPVYSNCQEGQIVDLTLDFAGFQNLMTLSLDHLWVTDEVLKQVSDLKLLKRLILLLDKEFKGHKAKNETWEYFHTKLPDCELRINLIKGINKDVMRIFSKSMPVTHIKLLYCGKVSLSLMSFFTWFEDLKSVWCLSEDDLEALLPEQNPLVMCAWTCHKLEELVIIGIKFDFEDLIGIARLRGSGMKRLEISSSNIVKLFDVQNTNFWESRNLFPTEMKSFSKKMSKALGRSWSPVDNATFKNLNLSSCDNEVNNIVEILSKDYEMESTI
ncbi:hypothetical protein RUM44_011639 [Polyplax serrata]